MMNLYVVKDLLWCLDVIVISMIWFCGLSLLMWWMMSVLINF